MWHQLSRSDFNRPRELMGSSSRGRRWMVCEEYEFRRLLDAPEGNADSYVLAPKHPYDLPYLDRWRSYEPLEDTPDLFLKFARLHWADDQIEAMVNWVQRYGTLGHGKPPWTAGAPQDVKGFREAVGQAAGVLTLYEAVLNGDSDRARTAILYEFPFVGIWWRMYNALPEKDAHMDREFVASQISESVEEIYGGDYLWHALATAADEVEYMVRNYCTPALSVEEGSRDPAGVTAQWIFKSLLGAMYLQMYWLMAAGNDLTRCEHCGLLISLARPNPEGRKRRRDKRFCDDACRQAHHRAKKGS